MSWRGRGRDEDFSSPPHRSRRALLTRLLLRVRRRDERFSVARRPTRSHYSDRRGTSAQCPNRGRLPLGEALPSTTSAGSCLPSFRRFAATLALTSQSHRIGNDEAGQTVSGGAGGGPLQPCALVEFSGVHRLKREPVSEYVLFRRLRRRKGNTASAEFRNRSIPALAATVRTFSQTLTGTNPGWLIAGMPAVQGIDGFVHRRHRRDFGKNPHGDRRQARLARA